MKRTIRGIFTNLPTLAAVLSLAAVGVWGQRTGWKAPRLEDLIQLGAQPEKEDWCATHNVPDSRCIACHPELAGESGADWCKEHGVPESRCAICHPELLTTGVAADWCREHGLPESCCTLCHPDIARKGELPPDPDAVRIEGPAQTQDQGMGPASRPTSQSATIPGAAGSKPHRPDPSTCQTHMLKVQFASATSMQRAGVKLGQVVERPMSDAVSAYAEVAYDPTRHARVSSRVPGTIRRVERNLGDAVRAGEVLAVVDSAEVGRAKADYLQAAAAVETAAPALARVQRSSEAGFRTAAERQEAEARSRETGIRLFTALQALANLGISVPSGGVSQQDIGTLGLPAELVSTLPPGQPSTNLLPLMAPFDGVVVKRDVVLGKVVDQKDVLLEIADPTRMQLVLDLSLADARRTALGQPVIFRPDDLPGVTAIGTVGWISTEVDEVTRTVKLRADVDNAKGELRAHTFGKARVVVRTEPVAVAVPNEALQWEGCCHIVFVRLADEIFQTRKVRLGAVDPAYTEVLGGLLPGEIVVTAGSSVLKAEILKSRLGAGCCAEK